MPIAQEEDDDFLPSSNVEVVQQTQPHVVSAMNVTPVVDTRFEPLSSLLQYIEGSLWQVNYYSQVVTNSSEAGAQQPGTHAVYQQYINIRDLEIHVTNPLSYLQDSVTNESVLTGSATLNPGVIANEGDMFTGDVGDGRMGVFAINEVVRKTHLLEACYEITYNFKGYADDQRQLLADLEVKTVKVDYYVKELLGSATKPFLAEKEVITLSLLKRYMNELVGMYFGLFFNREFSTLLMPESLLPTYDPFAIKALSAVLDVEEHPLLRKLKIFNVDGPDSINDSTIWSIILENQIDLLPTISSKMWLVGTVTFNKWPLLGSIYHSRLDSVVYPLNRMPGAYYTDVMGGTPMYPITPPEFSTIPPVDITQDPPGNPDGTLIRPPYINSVTGHDHYVLSPAFYNRTSLGQSILELMVSNYLNGKPFNALYLLDIFKDIPNWRPLDKFYQIPVLIILMKLAARRF